MGHFDSKSRIEEHVRRLPIDTTIIHPSTFREMLLLPGFGLYEGRSSFFMGPEQPMQFIAVEELGHLWRRSSPTPHGSAHGPQIA